MQISLTLNGKKITEEIAADLLLIDLVRNHGCYSVKRGCDTTNCGLCTVFMDDKPVLSCAILAARAAGHSIAIHRARHRDRVRRPGAAGVAAPDDDRGRIRR